MRDVLVLVEGKEQTGGHEPYWVWERRQAHINDTQSALSIFRKNDSTHLIGDIPLAEIEVSEGED